MHQSSGAGWPFLTDVACDYSTLHSQLQTLNAEHRVLEEKLSETEMSMLNSKDARVKQLQDKYDELSAQW